MSGIAELLSPAAYRPDPRGCDLPTCPVCADTIRSVSYSSYTVAYCPTCQTGGKVLADNTTSRFLK